MSRSRLPGSFTSGARWTGEEASIALAVLEDSGLSVNAFAEREGLDPQRLDFLETPARRSEGSPDSEVRGAYAPGDGGRGGRSAKRSRSPCAGVDRHSSALRALVAVLEDGAC